MEQYINHSGGAKGADEAWKLIGQPYGVETKDWRPEDLGHLSDVEIAQMLMAFGNAAKVLKRPYEFKGVALARRNWFQAHHAMAVYAIAHIIPPGGVCYQGFENETGKEIVAGGTGWAVEMAIQMNKRVYVFNMREEGFACWHVWNHEHKRFWPTFTPPILTQSFAGIGSRIITPEGIKAIIDVYEKTFGKKESKEGKETPGVL